MKNKVEQQTELESEVKKALEKCFPKSEIHYHSNYNDIASGFEIAPAPFETITVECFWNDAYKLRIKRFSIHQWKENIGVEKQVFNGSIPSDENSTPNFQILEIIFKNYQSF